MAIGNGRVDGRDRPPFVIRLSHTVDDVIVGYLSVLSPTSHSYDEISILAMPLEQWMIFIWQMRGRTLVENERLLARAAGCPSISQT